MSKFENSPECIEYFWNLHLSDESIKTSAGGIVKIEPEDLLLFPQLKAGNEIHFTEDENGFVMCQYVEVV